MYVGRDVKIAVTFCAFDIVTTQVEEVPEHAPLQPEKAAPVAALAVNVTDVPEV